MTLSHQLSLYLEPAYCATGNKATGGGWGKGGPSGCLFVSVFGENKAYKH